MKLSIAGGVALIVISLFVVATLVVWIGANFLRIGYAVWFDGWRSRRIDLGREYRSEQGLFVRKEHGWVGEMDFGGSRLQLDVRDDHGLPDSAFLRRLPGIVTKLTELECAARDGVSEVTDDYALDCVLSPVRSDDDCDFALGFSPKDEESYEMSIYVNFKRDRVVGWLGVD